MSEEKQQGPFDRVQDGNLNVTLWRQKGRYGDYLQSSGVKKTYEDDEGQLRETSSLSGIGEHVRATRLMGRASERIEQYRQTMKTQSQKLERER